MKVFLFVLILMNFVFFTFSNKAEIELLKILLSEYNINVRPVKDIFQPIIVELNFFIVSLHSINEKDQISNTYGWLRMKWLDEYMTWNRSDYDVSKVMIDSSLIWVPEYLIRNSVESIQSDLFDRNQFKVVITNRGEVTYFSAGKYSTLCALDMTYFPYDLQTCYIHIDSWSYGENQIKFRKASDKVITKFYRFNGIWNLIDSKVSEYVEDGSAQVKFIMYWKRLPHYHLSSIILPCFLMSIMTLFVFLLPPDSGEKVSLSITALLSFTVFQISVEGKMPERSDNRPLIASYIIGVMILTALSLLSTIIVLMFHHQNYHHPPPKWLKTIVLKWFWRFLFRKKSKINLNENKFKEEDGNTEKPENKNFFRMNEASIENIQKFVFTRNPNKYFNKENINNKINVDNNNNKDNNINDINDKNNLNHNQENLVSLMIENSATTKFNNTFTSTFAGNNDVSDTKHVNKKNFFIDNEEKIKKNENRNNKIFVISRKEDTKINRNKNNNVDGNFNNYTINYLSCSSTQCSVSGSSLNNSYNSPGSDIATYPKVMSRNNNHDHNHQENYRNKANREKYFFLKFNNINSFSNTKPTITESLNKKKSIKTGETIDKSLRSGSSEEIVNSIKSKETNGTGNEKDLIYHTITSAGEMRKMLKGSAPKFPTSPSGDHSHYRWFRERRRTIPSIFHWNKEKKKKQKENNKNDCVDAFLQKMLEEADVQENKTQWMRIAYVMDRFFGVVFSVCIISLSVIIFGILNYAAPSSINNLK